MIGTYKNFNDAVVVNSDELPAMLIHHNEHIDAIDSTVKDGNWYYALIGDGYLKGSLSEWDDVLPDYSYSSYFSYLNQYQEVMSKKKFTITIEFSDESTKEIKGTPKELKKLVIKVKDKDAYFTIYADGEEIGDGYDDEILDYLKNLGSEI